VRRVIVTGDDFGLAVPVNEAIVEAHCRGILTGASLMVGAKAAADAIARARQLPSLRVGLHITLVEGHPILPPRLIPDLINGDGAFIDNPTHAGFKFALWPRIRQQLEAEIRAQFEVFKQTGLELDHADVHNHLHLNPRILHLVLRVGHDYGLKAVRLPYEAPMPAWRATRTALVGRVAAWVFLYPLICGMKRSLRKAGVRYNDFILGMIDTGGMTQDRVVQFLKYLPEGVTEIHFHPATRRCVEIDRTMSHYLNVEEYEALISPQVLAAFEAAGVERIAFSDL
jgi:hopanoid biosynthesis associated protein HpnK